MGRHGDRPYQSRPSLSTDYGRLPFPKYKEQGAKDGQNVAVVHQPNKGSFG